MFARTERLLLRPPFPEDAAAIATAIGDESVVRNLVAAPFPYRESDADAFIAHVTAQDGADRRLPCWLMMLRTAGVPRIIGGVGITHRADDGELELGYWVARSHWGLGFATEAARHAVRTARAMGLPPLTSGHFVDNPASGAVLRKVGFRPSGKVAPRFSLARGGDVDCLLFAEDRDADLGPMPSSAPSDDDLRSDWRLHAA